MLFIALVLLLTPSLASALGAEDSRFYGLLNDGQLLQLNFAGDPAPWTQNNFLYGAKSSAAFAFCWGTKEKEASVAFNCTSDQGTRPGLSYRALIRSEAQLSYGSKSPEMALYRKIAKKARLGTGRDRGDATLVTIFECADGCTSATPRYLFEVGFYD